MTATSLDLLLETHNFLIAVQLVGGFALFLLGFGYMLGSLKIKQFSGRVILTVILIIAAIYVADENGFAIPKWIYLVGIGIFGLQAFQFVLNLLFGRDVGSTVISELIISVVKNVLLLIAGPFKSFKKYFDKTE